MNWSKLSRDQRRAVSAEIARQERQDQGLSAVVEDDDTYRHLAKLLTCQATARST